MRFRGMYQIVLLLFCVSMVICSNPREQRREESIHLLSERLRSRVEWLETSSLPINMGDERIYASRALPVFYERRAFHPAWINDQGPGDQITDLINAVGNADSEGLRSDDYHLEKIKGILKEIRERQRSKQTFNPGHVTDLELLCTDSFLIYASHLLSGRVNPETIDSEWLANRRERDMAAVLEQALKRKRIRATLDSLLPRQAGYQRMRTALARFRTTARSGGWDKLPEGMIWQEGDSGNHIIELRRRMNIFLAPGLQIDSGNPLYDASLAAAVRIFQSRSGLDVSGIVENTTLNELNISVEDRIGQIEVNMERWRWLPQDLGRHYILINIANFELDVIEDDNQVMTMKVVTGKPYRRTPVFSDRMTYLVFNPYWNVPPGIAANDILPAIQKNPSYLTERKIRVFKGWGADMVEMDPSSIDWISLSPDYFPYRFRQDPGPQNALGRIKFMFPNKFSIYLHDTPSRDLFAKTERAFSSGCIRLENPVKLAEYVLNDNPKWNLQAITAALDSGEEHTVSLPEPVPVHILYWTAWAEEDGAIHFRKDIYDRDRPLLEALKEGPPQT